MRPASRLSARNSPAWESGTRYSDSSLKVLKTSAMAKSFFFRSTSRSGCRFEITGQVLRADRILHLGNGLGFDLTNPFSRDFEYSPDFLERI